MIYIKFNDDPYMFEVKFKRISPNVVSVTGTEIVNTSGFKTYSSSGENYGDFSDYKTVYKGPFMNEVLYSNDGSVYIKPEEPKPEEPSIEVIKQNLIDGVQNYMDEVAATRGYDSILSACSYIDSGIEKFDTEGAKARRWRSAVWAYCYAQLDLFLEGELTEVPTIEALIDQLPVLDW